ncbi:MAG: hypothetical protein IRZ21_06550 [Thermoleophilaceae bacterium]|nr:hypothetical protein [Thermoleophilaceae bacterium]
MPETIQHHAQAAAPVTYPGVELPQVDERAARRTLLDQIARLEGELSGLLCAAFPRNGLDCRVRARGGPRILSLAELERVRDDLAARAQDNRRRLSERLRVEQRNRHRLEQMLLDPAAHKWERVTNADIGEPGCKQWHVLPRFGLLGMLMGWWRVKISSGCPLPPGRGPRPRPLAPRS